MLAEQKKSLMDKALENTGPGRNVILSQSLKSLNKLTKGKYRGQYSALECVLFASANSPKAAYAKEAAKFAELINNKWHRDKRIDQITKLPVHPSCDQQTKYWDDLSGKQLIPSLVHQARSEEMEEFRGQSRV